MKERLSRWTSEIVQITEDEEGNIYFSYYNSIHKLEKTTGVLMPLFPKNDYRQPPFGLAYAQGALWTGNGLRIDLKTLKTDTIFSNQVNDKGVVIVDENSLWFGFENNSIVTRVPIKPHSSPIVLNI